MTSYTRKLYDREHGSKGRKPSGIRLRYGRQTQLAGFSLQDEIRAYLPDGRVVAHIDQEWDVNDNLQRWADRRFRSE